MQFMGIRLMLFFFTATAFVAITAGNGAAQLPDFDPWKPDPDFVTVGEPERIDGTDGKYKLAYKNNRNLVFREEEFEVTGSVMQARRKTRLKNIVGFYNDGRPKGYQLTDFGEDPNTIDDKKPGPTIRYETVNFDAKGNRISRKVWDSKPYTIDKVRETTWTEGSGPEGITVSKQFNRELGRWEIVKESPFEGKWRLESNGTKYAGEFVFVDSGPLLEIRRESKLWWLTFKNPGVQRSVVRPASSAEDLGLTSRLVQLRGDPTGRRFEVWATTDLTPGSEFSNTGHALVKEGN